MLEQILIQILFVVLFLALSLVYFTLPGIGILRRFDIKLPDFLEKYTLSTIIGLTLFTLTAYLLSVINLRFLLWAFPLVGLIAGIRGLKDEFKFNFSVKYKKVFLAILIIGGLGQIAVNAPSGLFHDQGIYFYSSHGHDGVWHLALIENLKNQTFPFQNPEFAGHRLQNYHFFVDLLMSEISRLFFFTGLDIYFRLLPTLFAILMGFSSFIFARFWAKKESAGLWAMFSIYFIGSFGYLVTLPRDGDIFGESIFWVSQTQSVLGNPPHAAAFIILAGLFFLLLKFFEERKIKYLIPAALLAGSVIEFKVYAGSLVLGGLMVASIWELIYRRSVTLILFFLTTLGISLGIYLPNSLNSQEFLIWEPWWFIRSMVVATDRLNMLDMELRRQTYVAEHNWKRVIQLETTALLIFLFGNLGMRFVGFWSALMMFRQNIFKNTFNIFFISMTVASFWIPVFFIQKGVVWNAIQFNQYFLYFFGFLAALTYSDLLGRIKNYPLKVGIITLIIILSVPTQIGLLWLFYANKPLSKVSYGELDALKFLSQNTPVDSVVLTAPFDKYMRDGYMPPIPIYTWYETGYVTAFSDRETLIADSEQVEIMGYDAKGLLRDREEAFDATDSATFNKFLKDTDVDYLYLSGKQNFTAPENELEMQLIYSNVDSRVYKINK